MNAPHFRIVFPKSSMGSKHVAYRGRVFVTFPGESERQLTNVKRVQIGDLGDGGAWEIELVMFGSAAVEYVDEDAT